MSHRFHHGPLVAQHTERAFPEPALWAVLTLLLVLLAIGLAGCASSGYSLTQGGISDATSSFGSDHNFSFSCSKFDPVTGLMTDQVIVNRNLTPNAAVVAQVGAAMQAVIGMVGAAGKVAKPGPPGAMGARGVPNDSQLDVPTCLGEHGVNTPMPNPPNPTPPQQGSAQQPSARETGQNPRPYAPAAYAAPSLDRSGVAHAAEDNPDAALQQRLADASSRTEYAR